VPLNFLVPLEYRAVFNVFKELTVALLVLLLDLGDLCEALGDVKEPFLIGHLREVWVESSPLQELTFGSREEVLEAYGIVRGAGFHCNIWEETLLFDTREWRERDAAFRILESIWARKAKA